ncbi:MAG: Crp/Fnr family transcriptional regulator [Aquabacterium sp.]
MAVLSPAQLDTLRCDLWFGALPADLADALIAQGALRRLAHAQHLFFRGDAPDGIYAVLSGTLRVSGVTPSGKEALLALLDPPAWFGEIALFDRLPRTHDAQACGEVAVLHVPQPALQAMLRAQPDWWPHFGVLLALKTRLLMISHEGHALASQEGMLARRLLWMVRSSEAGFRLDKARLKINQETLGQMLAMARQTVNRILKDMEARGVLRVTYGTVEVLDIVRLADAAELSVMERRVLQHLTEGRVEPFM